MNDIAISELMYPAGIRRCRRVQTRRGLQGARDTAAQKARHVNSETAPRDRRRHHCEEFQGSRRGGLS